METYFIENYYICLLTDVELNDLQKHIWFRLVEIFLDAEEYSPHEVKYINGTVTKHEESDGNKNFPFAYIVKMNNMLTVAKAERIVAAWDEIYPRDFQIETNIEHDEIDQDAEIDEDRRKEIQQQVSKFLHNRWVERQIQKGWRYGIKKHKKEKTDPRLRDWVSLNKNYRREIDLSFDDALMFLKKYPHLFV